MTLEHRALAQENFSKLLQNSYLGRGIVVGMDEESRYLIQLYWIMGRGEQSRNRIFKADVSAGRLYTEFADSSTGGDPSLVIYNAMREKYPSFVVSNGHQTDNVIDSAVTKHLNLALKDQSHEPDSPNFTPRITAVTSLAGESSRIQISILRKSMLGDECERALYEYTSYSGFGYCITTYTGDGNPLPSFRGDPLIMPLQGNPKAILETYWGMLNPDNRVAIAVKFIDRESGVSNIDIINKYTQV